MPQSYNEKLNLNLIGKYGVMSELFKRNINASLPNGRFKNIEVKYEDNSKATIIVKTSRTDRFVTNYSRPNFHDDSKPHPDYWVITHVDNDNKSHYYILTHDEMGVIQKDRNRIYRENHPSSDGVGCDNVLLSNIKNYENKWDSITNHI